MYYNEHTTKSVDDHIYLKSDAIKYYIGNINSGKSGETLKQAFLNQAVLIAKNNYFHLPKVKDITDRRAAYLSVGEIVFDTPPDDALETLKGMDGKVHVCVDNGRMFIQELLGLLLNTEVKVDFISLDTGEGGV